LIINKADESEESIVKNLAIPDWRRLKSKTWKLDSADTKAQISKTDFSYYEPEDTTQGHNECVFR
jgi:hypothetical protein